MALLKIMQVGDELVFDLTRCPERLQRISVKLSEKTGRAAALVIRADRSIPIEHLKHTPVDSGVVEIGDDQSVQRFINGKDAATGE